VFSVFQNETWTYDYGTNAWTNALPAGSPGRRTIFGMAYDVRADRTILFGELDNATWAYDARNRTWTDLAPANHPPWREDNGLVYDPAANRIVTFGGLGASSFLGDTWLYDYYELPDAPPTLLAAPGNGQVMLTWQPPASDGGKPVTGYRVYRGIASGTEAFLRSVGAVLTTVDGGLTNGQPYFYEVSAVTAIGEGPRSREASATPTTATVPSPPRNLAATGGNRNVSLAWEAPSSDGGAAIEHYRVYRGTASGGEAFLIELGSGLATTDLGLTNGVAYFYKVTAVNIAGEGGPSNEASATPTPIGLLITANPTSGVGPLTVAFTSAASGGTEPYAYAWKFGDGDSTASRNATHTYGAVSTATTYTASLTVTDAEGTNATRTVAIIVNPVSTGPPPAAPIPVWIFALPVIAAVLLLLLIVFLRRRRRSPEPSAPPPPPMD